MSILVATAATVRDAGVERVIAALRDRGAAVVRFDTDAFPTERTLSLSLDEADRLTLAGPDGAVDLAGLSAVWIRHFDTAARLPAGMEPDHREAARVQSEASVWSALECLPVFLLDPPAAVRQAPYKPRQLQLARAAGLAVPRTLLSNDPAAVRAFAGACPGGVIAKLVDGASVGVMTEAGEAPLYTFSLTPEDLEALDALRLSPMLFQERVPKASELRITIVGRRVFAAAVDSSRSTAAADDWRRDRALAAAFYPLALPADTEARLLALTRGLGLGFATVDMIRTPDGRDVFIELNTTSYFDFIEAATGLPIAAAIADLLLTAGRRPGA